jgi:hypothetical protein
MVGTGGFGAPASAVSVLRSYRLSYVPMRGLGRFRNSDLRRVVPALCRAELQVRGSLRWWSRQVRRCDLAGFNRALFI